jgi:hypothetical protein
MNAIMTYRARPEMLNGSVMPALSSGVVVGHGRDQRPVVVRLFRPEPTLVALIGGWWVARLVAFRAVAVGARIAVHPAVAALWRGFAAPAAGPDGQPQVYETDQPLAVPATGRQPLLYVYDGATTPPPNLGPWCTGLAVLGRLLPAMVSTVAGAHLCMAQRVTPADAADAVTALRLSGDTASHLQSMPDNVVALFGGGVDRYVLWAQTQTEQHYFGPPTRD